MIPAILGIVGSVLTQPERELFRASPPRGVILFGRNIKNKTQLSDLTADLRASLPAGAVLMVDQEGGRVARLKPPHWPALPAAGTLASSAAAYAHGLTLGRLVHEAGFDITTAPVLDLRLPGASDVIGDRALNADPAIVARLGGEVARGLMEAGITPVMKHLPGHGRARVDSHVALPRVPALTEDDLLPFIANRHLPWAMTAHVVFENFDALRPATLSPMVIREIIRGRIGFTGTLVSDDLAMGALSGTPAERAKAALAAGCDIALYCPGDMAGNRAILDALA